MKKFFDKIKNEPHKYMKLFANISLVWGVLGVIATIISFIGLIAVAMIPREIYSLMGGSSVKTQAIGATLILTIGALVTAASELAAGIIGRKAARTGEADLAVKLGVAGMVLQIFTLLDGNLIGALLGLFICGEYFYSAKCIKEATPQPIDMFGNDEM